MNIDHLKRLIKEEIQKEIQVKPPGYIVNSPEYKKFYQLIDLMGYWGVDGDINPEGNVYFDPFLNDFYFFYMLWTSTQKQNWTPNYCLLTNDDYETMISDHYRLDENDIEQIKAKFKEHSK